MSKFVATYFSALCTMYMHAYTQSKELQSRLPKASLWHDYFTVWMLWRQGRSTFLLATRSAFLLLLPFYPRAETIYSRPSFRPSGVALFSIKGKLPVHVPPLPLRTERESDRISRTPRCYEIQSGRGMTDKLDV